MPLKSWLDENDNLDEFESAWDRFREVNHDGISKISDNIIRDLHAGLGMLLSNKKYTTGILDTEVATIELQLDLLCAKLLNTIYNEHTVVKRNEYEMRGDERYIIKVNELNEIKSKLVIAKAEINALEIATGVLSRELSYRISKN